MPLTPGGHLLVIWRFDIESFAFDPRRGRAFLYPPPGIPLFDQSRLLARLVEVLDRHAALGSFAVSYSIVKNAPDMMRDVVRSRGDHELTYHLHPRWDGELSADTGIPMRSSFLADYDEAALEGMWDLVESRFLSAFGFAPRVSFCGNASVSTRMLGLLEKRGYLVQGDYCPNMDYRLCERMARANALYGRPDFVQGPTAPVSPYAADSIYFPDRNEGMLMGRMPVAVVPLSQISPGEGLRVDTVFTDPDATIQALARAYARTTGVGTFMLCTHTCFGLAAGPEPEAVNETYLANLDRVLQFVDGLEDVQYATCLPARERYLGWLSENDAGEPHARDVRNGVFIVEGRQSVKFHSDGRGGDNPMVTMSQDNGIAEWLVGGQLLGPGLETKRDWEVLRRPSLLTCDLLRGGKLERLSRADLAYRVSTSTDAEGPRVCVESEAGEVKNVYTIRRSQLGLRTTAPRACTVIHRVNFSPSFRVQSRFDGRQIVLRKPGGPLVSVSTNAHLVDVFRTPLHTALRLLFPAGNGEHDARTNLFCKEDADGSPGD